MLIYLSNNMRPKIGFLLLCSILLCSIKGLADGNVYTLKYSFDEAEGTAIVTGYEGTPENMVVPAEIVVNGKQYIVTSIGENAFQGCRSLISLELPATLKSIEKYAFANCSSLISLEFPVSLISIGDYAFDSCISLPSVELPRNIVTIGEGAFLWCSSLTFLELPEALTSIGDYAFRGCALQIITYLTHHPVTADENVFDYEVYDSMTPATLKIPHGTREIFMATAPWKMFRDIETDLPTEADIIDNNDIHVQIINASTILINGLQGGEEIAVYSRTGRLIRTETAPLSSLRIGNLMAGNVYIIRINNNTVKIMI